MMHSVDHLIDMALAEDIGPGDITTGPLVGPEQTGSGRIVAKEPLVLAGLDVARQVFAKLDAAIDFRPLYADGARLEGHETVLEVAGRLSALLEGERTALNFLQRLSGIATHVHHYVEHLGAAATRLVDTRKTTPGWRVLEKYAVRVGGAANHRMGLYDGVLIKDNHIAVGGGIAAAVEKVRRQVSHLVKIEVEVEDMEQVRQALAAGVDVIMLDNMALPAIRQAVAEIAGRAVVEVSGGVTRDRIRALADAGVDLISVGALTHAARSVDLSMRIDP